MKKLQFNTNINCNNCIRSVSGFLDDIHSIESWEVDINNPEKVLTVYGEEIDASMIISKVQEAGFQIHPRP